MNATTPPIVITILAGGWSASLVNLEKLPGTVIAVNDAAVHAPHCDIVVSMDRLWAEHRIDWVRGQQKQTWLRASTLKNVWVDDSPWVIPFANDHTSTMLSEKPRTLNGTHSGFCALNLAYHLRPQSLYLVGFDMARGPKDEAHWFPQYPWVSKHATGRSLLAEWAKQFDTAARQLARAHISVYLVGSLSPVQSFARIAPEQLCAV